MLGTHHMPCCRLHTRYITCCMTGDTCLTPHPTHLGMRYMFRDTIRTTYQVHITHYMPGHTLYTIHLSTRPTQGMCYIPGVLHTKCLGTGYTVRACIQAICAGTQSMCGHMLHSRQMAHTRAHATHEANATCPHLRCTSYAMCWVYAMLHNRAWAQQAWAHAQQAWADAIAVPTVQDRNALGPGALTRGVGLNQCSVLRCSQPMQPKTTFPALVSLSLPQFLSCPCFLSHLSAVLPYCFSIPPRFPLLCLSSPHLSFLPQFPLPA